MPPRFDRLSHTRDSPGFRTTLTSVTGIYVFKINTDRTQLESNFLPLNPKVHVSPTQLAWHPFDLPPDSARVDFVDGLHTLAGNGDPTMKEGLAIHIYTANASMENKAFCNNDGDMLILPQQGRLDVQTEFGK
jgi:homogentisate 1,2-dioxygenase